MSLTSPHPLQIRHLPEGASAVERTLDSILRQLPISIWDFIPETEKAAILGGTSTYDCAPAIQAAVNEAEARGGAYIEFGPGKFCIQSTIVVDSSGIILRGQGGPGAATSKVAYRASAKTTIYWTGTAGGTMFRLTSNAADDGTLGPVQGTAGIDAMLLDCAESAAVGVEIRTWTYGRFAHTAVAYATQYGWLITTLDNGVLSGAADTQHCEFFNCSYNEINTANGCDAGVVIGKGAAADQGNVSLCSFFNLHSNVEGGGMAMSLENCDNLYFYYYRGQSRTGVGGTTVLQAGDTGFLNQGAGWDDGCRYCMFFGASGSFVAKQAGGVADHSFGNMIIGLTRANGLPFPTIEDNANLFVIETGGSGSSISRGASLYGRRSRGHLANIGITTSIANNTATEITTYDSAYNTEGALLVNGAGIVVPAGVYACSVEAKAGWAVNAIGIREVVLLVNGVAVTPSVQAKNMASDTGGSYITAVAIELPVDPGDVLTMQVTQTSGGPLNLNQADSYIRVRWL